MAQRTTGPWRRPARRPPARGPGRLSWSSDDEPTIRMLVGEILHEAGYGAIEAESGFEC
jgi:hypothetical protein